MNISVYYSIIRKMQLSNSCASVFWNIVSSKRMMHLFLKSPRNERWAQLSRLLFRSSVNDRLDSVLLLGATQTSRLKLCSIAAGRQKSRSSVPSVCRRRRTRLSVRSVIVNPLRCQLWAFSKKDKERRKTCSLKGFLSVCWGTWRNYLMTSSHAEWGF